MNITNVTATEILDSRGNPTLEVIIKLDDGSTGIAAVPSGASTGIHEAVELRDDDASRYGGKGVLKAVENVNKTVAETIIGSSYDQASLDDALIKLDGTPNKAKLGANAILGVSMAFARAVAASKGIELHDYLAKIGEYSKLSLPQPMLNIINGGKHADSGLDVQEFMLAPVGFPTFARKVQAGAEVISALRSLLKKAGYTISVGDEGGFAPALKSNEEALDLMVQAIESAGYTTDQIKIAMDAAASSFFHDGKYHLRIQGEVKELSSTELIDWYEQLLDKYPIMLIEDGLAEDDWSGFQEMTKRLGNRVTVVGDDLLVTNISRIEQAIQEEAVNSVLIKLNQIGTVTETLNAIQLTQRQGWIPFVSHRSGETTDTFIADLAVGLGCPLIKSGSLVRGERVCKYNRLMKIERDTETV
jgi:enolase